MKVHWPTVLASFLYFDVSFMAWLLIGALGNHIGADLKLSDFQKAILVAVPLLGGAVVRVPLGILGDRRGHKRAGILTLAATMAAAATLWLWAGNFAEVLGVGFLLGFAGGSFAIALPLAGRWSPPERRGLTMGLVGAGNSGTVLATLFAPIAAEAFGWRGAAGLALIPLASVLVVFCLAARETPPDPSRATGREALAWGDMLRFVAFYAFTFGGFVGLASYLGIFFRDQYGISKVGAGVLTSACVIGGSVVRPVGGHLADRFGAPPVLSFVFLAAGALLMVVSHIPPLPAAVTAFAALLALLGTGNGAVFALVPRRFPRELGLATGVVGAAGGLGGFALPLCLGKFKELTGGYGPGFMTVGLSGLFALAILMTAQRGWERTWLEPGLVRRGNSPDGVRSEEPVEASR